MEINIAVVSDAVQNPNRLSTLNGGHVQNRVEFIHAVYGGTQWYRDYTELSRWAATHYGINTRPPLVMGLYL